MPIWGEGLWTRHYLRGSIGLRRNLYVYEVTLIIARIHLTFRYYRKTKRN
jgi:hypothetical protein